jgi:hypothetical protein
MRNRVTRGSPPRRTSTVTITATRKKMTVTANWIGPSTVIVVGAPSGGGMAG